MENGVALADLSHWGVLELRGEDRLKFLNGQCTNKLVDAVPMDVKRACFINKVRVDQPMAETDRQTDTLPVKRACFIQKK